jgi:hypothetical protein
MPRIRAARGAGDRGGGQVCARAAHPRATVVRRTACRGRAAPGVLAEPVGHRMRALNARWKRGGRRTSCLRSRVRWLAGDIYLCRGRGAAGRVGSRCDRSSPVSWCMACCMSSGMIIPTVPGGKLPRCGGGKNAT